MGKSAINGPFSMAMLNNQRVSSIQEMQMDGNGTTCREKALTQALKSKDAKEVLEMTISKTHDSCRRQAHVAFRNRTPWKGSSSLHSCRQTDCFCTSNPSMSAWKSPFQNAKIPKFSESNIIKPIQCSKLCRRFRLPSFLESTMPQVPALESTQAERTDSMNRTPKNPLHFSTLKETSAFKKKTNI